MSRLQRRMRLAALAREPFERGPRRLRPTGIRGQAARRIRTELRQMRPILLRAPRWSSPQAFLEELALDLAVGEPGLGCRTAGFRPGVGRSLPELWHETLQAFAQLGQPRWVEAPLRICTSRRAFREMLRCGLAEAEERARHRVALLLYGTEHLPREIMEDICLSWNDVAPTVPRERRCALLLAGAVGTLDLPLGDASTVDLVDYGEEERVEALAHLIGPFPPRALREFARFTGGVPALVEALGACLRSGHTPVLRAEALLAGLGPMADELRAVVDIARSEGLLADRLAALCEGEPLPEEPELDGRLRLAGLARRVRLPGPPQVELRSPAIAALAG